MSDGLRMAKMLSVAAVATVFICVAGAGTCNKMDTDARVHETRNNADRAHEEAVKAMWDHMPAPKQEAK